MLFSSRSMDKAMKLEENNLKKAIKPSFISIKNFIERLGDVFN